MDYVSSRLFIPSVEKIFSLLGRVGLNVITNGTLSDSCLVDVSKAWLREIQELGQKS